MLIITNWNTTKYVSNLYNIRDNNDKPAFSLLWIIINYRTIYIKLLLKHLLFLLIYV